jgi:hypothetical protein
MPRFRLTGFGRDTKRNRTHIYRAANLEEALKKASQDGTIVDMSNIVEIPDEPATENQKRYAKELGISYPPDITESDMYMLLSQVLKDDKYQDIDASLPPTEKQIAFMKEKKKEIPANITRRELSKIIDKILEQELDNLENNIDSNSEFNDINNISQEAIDLLKDKPYAWEFRLFSIVLSDEIKKASNLKKSIEIEINSKYAAKIKNYEDIIEIQQKQINEIMDSVKSSVRLVTIELVKSVGEKEQSGNAKEIVNIGKSLGDIYQSIIISTISFKNIQVDKIFSNLYQMIYQISLDAILGIEEFSFTLNNKLSDAVQKYEQTKEDQSIGTIKLNLIELSKIKEMNEEIERISRNF